MRIKIIQIGKNKDHYVDEGVNEFLKRLGVFFDVEVITLKETTASRTFPADRCIEEDGSLILRALDKADKSLTVSACRKVSEYAGSSKNADSFVVALDENGQQFGSVEFSEFLRKKNDVGQTVTFIIGGPYGLSGEVKKRANLLLSFSKMTFTHQMIRLFLLEQLYRAGCIMRGKEYHIV